MSARLLQKNENRLLLHFSIVSASQGLDLVHSNAIVRYEFQPNSFRRGPQRQCAPQEKIERRLAWGGKEALGIWDTKLPNTVRSQHSQTTLNSLGSARLWAYWL